jgi:hypothetical protein
MEGWIKIHRHIKDHWIWKSDHRLKWWLDILLTVNHADAKVLIKGNLIDCKRGQSVRSLETWAKDWNVTKKTVKEFFELLQKDSMLLYESIKISTRITVCNYDNYQTEVNGSETQSKRKVNGSETDTTPKQECKEEIKNDNNDKKRVSAKKAERDFIDDIIQLFIEAHGDYIIVNNGEERKMAAKILGIYKKKYPDSTSEETLIALKNYFNSCVNISDAWLKTNMSLSTIVSKFNQISKILKNGNSKKSGATYADIARITHQNFPEQFTE